jgi:hypothetical protein
MKAAYSFNHDTVNVEERTMIYVAIVIVVVSRCEYTEITISEFDNQVMVIEKNYNDPTIEEIVWGKWEKNGNEINLIFDNRTEIYEYDKKSNELVYISTKNALSFITFTLHRNLKLVKIKKGE